MTRKTIATVNSFTLGLVPPTKPRCGALGTVRRNISNLEIIISIDREELLNMISTSWKSAWLVWPLHWLQDGIENEAAREAASR